MVDAYGQEHMIMTFYVRGEPEGTQVQETEATYLDSISSWMQNAGASLSDLSFDEAVEWSKEKGQTIWDKSIRAFKYLSGSPLPPQPLPKIPESEIQESKKTERSAWSFAGVFSSLKGPKSSAGETSVRSSGTQHTEGEVHADLIKVRLASNNAPYGI